MEKHKHLLLSRKYFKDMGIRAHISYDNYLSVNNYNLTFLYYNFVKVLNRRDNTLKIYKYDSLQTLITSIVKNNFKELTEISNINQLKIVSLKTPVVAEA